MCICIIYIYKYNVYKYIYIHAIMKTMCPPSYRHNGFVATHVLWPKCMSIALLKV